MKIVKEAFKEGRNTTVPWKKSKAKQNSLKLDVALENYSAMNDRQKNAIMPLHMICPNTGKILATFPNRLSAAKYICTHILDRPDKNPVSITGNMEICMRAGWKSYGYYWKIADEKYARYTERGSGGEIPAALEEHAINNPFARMGMPIFYRVNGKNFLFDSIVTCAKELGKTIHFTRRIIVPNSGLVLPGKLIMPYNKEVKVISFKTKVEAAKYFNCGIKMINRILKSDELINNYEIIIED